MDNMLIAMLLGLSAASMPYIVSRTIAFGVRIPSTEFKNPFLKRLRIIWVAVNLIVFTFIGLTENINLIEGNNSIPLFIVMGFNLLNFVIFNQLVKRFKASQNWKVSNKIVVPLVSEHKTFNYRLFLLFPLVIFITFVITSYYEVFSVSLLIEQLVASVFYTVLVISAVKSRKQLSSQNPEHSFFVVSKFRFNVLMSLLSLGVIMTAIFGLNHLLEAGVITGQINNNVLIGTTVIFGLIFLNMLYAGNKRNRSELESDILEHNDDKHWKLGLFYVNSNDSSVFIEKRNSIGWTVNFGNKYVLIVVAAIVIFYTVIFFK